MKRNFVPKHVFTKVPNAAAKGEVSGAGNPRQRVYQSNIKYTFGLIFVMLYVLHTKVVRYDTELPSIVLLVCCQISNKEFSFQYNTVTTIGFS